MAAEPELRPLLDTLTTGVLHLGPQLEIRYLNPAAEELLGLTPRLTPNAPLAELLPRATELFGRLSAAAREGQGYQHRELVVPTADPGRAVTVDCTITPLIEGAAPHDLLVELYPLDRHLAIAREDALLSQQETWRQLTRALAHEVKNPLGGLRGAAQLLERELPDPALREYTRIVIAEADRLRALVDALLGPARPMRRTHRNVHELVEHVLSVVAAERATGVEFQRDYDPSLPEPEVDGDQLVQALLNLVRNALQALESGGRVTLRTRALRQYTVGATRHRLAVRVDVEDDGPGVPEALRDRLFFPLVSGRASGTGLGLGIAQDLVARHGGVIEWDSRPGRTVFSIVLPLAQQGRDDR
jgi:two-component system nitrogen regulation sensor histidine kinase GlnL